MTDTKKEQATTGGIQVNYVINLHKLLIVPVYLTTLQVFGGGLSSLTSQSFAYAALLLLSSHGFYGFAWVFKDIHFPDKRFQNKVALPIALLIFFGPLGVYDLPMFCLVSDRCGPRFATGNEPLLLFAASLCFNIGMFFTYGSDMQKNIMLNAGGKPILMTSGFFKYTRNPNYFGEVLIYTAYGLYSTSYLIFGLWFLVWVGIFIPNMRAKEKSLSRYPEFADWKASTGFFFPSRALWTDMFKYAFSNPPESFKPKKA